MAANGRGDDGIKNPKDTENLINEENKTLADHRKRYSRSNSGTNIIDVDGVSDISEPIYEQVCVRGPDAKTGSDSSHPRTVSDEGYADSQTAAYDNAGFLRQPGDNLADDESDCQEFPGDDLHTQSVKLELPDLPEDELAVLKKYLAEPRLSIVKPWDVFRVVSDDEEGNTESRCVLVCLRITKVVLAGVFMLLVLAGAICAKGTLLFIASHVRRDIDFVCNIDNDTTVNFCYREPVVNFENSSLLMTMESMGFRPSDGIQIATQTIFDGVQMDTVSSKVHAVSPVPLGFKPEAILIPAYNNSIFVRVRMCEEVTMRWAWALLLVSATPNIFAWTRCVWRMIFKKTKQPRPSTIGFAILMETIHEAGSSLFVFQVLPTLNIVRALVVMMGVCVIPGLLRIFNRPENETKRPLKLACDIIAAVAQISLVFIWPLTINFKGTREKMEDMWPITVSLILLSLGWWESFVDKNTKVGSFGRFLLKMKRRLVSTRSKAYAIVYLYKLALGLAFMVLWLWLLGGYHPAQLFNFSTNGAYCKDIHEGGFNISLAEYSDINHDWVFAWLVQMSSGFAVFLIARIACQIKIQPVGFALPLVLAPLITFGLLIGACETWNNNPLLYGSVIPTYLFWNCYPKDELGDVALSDSVWIIAIWWLSELAITRHIWFPRAERMAKTSKLFVKSCYSAICVEQSLTLNRRLDDTEFRKETKAKDYGLDGDEFQVDYYNISQTGDTPNADPFATRRSDTTPMIYLAATMWHENEQEMHNLLKSVFRLDIDQSARRNAQQFLDIVDPDYYEFEAHIFFDDAFSGHGFDDDEYTVNDFVKQLVLGMDKAASTVHKVSMRIPAPVRYDTPYGGRLEWRLPGGNRLVAHLKDKVKIRHKKRWSQVMYMYYFLGHRLWAQTDDAKRKQLIADNTFVLALDGDVDFMPKSVQLLVDLMKKNTKVGAACGRIHPIGSGPMVWYQQFEYAIGHWFQKATEHMIGCVLCSPGCFSLFRGSALMDDNVMKRYTTIATEPSQFVQYDQGEDRWLCTLMLQQGWRVEYCAASDSWTFAPEGFNEFYNQRRRWTPSTMANILDLLAEWKHTIKRNENISLPYIVYQGALMMSTILGPGTIFLMIMGALQTAFGRYGLSLWGAFACNIIPLVIFVIICFVCKSETQLLVAGVLSAVYAVVQMLVIVGLALSIKEEGFCSPSAIFLFAVISFFVIAAILHPQEFFCIVPGALYFLLIPSMYLFLIIYSMCNMHVVSWGTREVKSATVPKAQDNHPKEGPDAKNKLLDKLNVEALKDKEEGFDCSLGSCFRCVCCPRPVENSSGKHYLALLNKFDKLEAYVKENLGDRKGNGRERLTSEASIVSANRPGALPDITEESPQHTSRPSSDSEEDANEGNFEEAPRLGEDNDIPKYDDIPNWLKDLDAHGGPVEKLDEQESEFWKGMIMQYLFPLENNKEHQKQVAEGLLELRNKTTFAFFIFNALFVVIIFTLQLQKETGDLIVRWPCFEDGRDYIEVEPIGFAFLVFFGIIMLIQFLGMIFHRMGTLWHILASTTLGCAQKSDAHLLQENVEGAIELAKRLQALKGVDDDDRRSSVASTFQGSDEQESEYVTVRKKKHITRLAKNKSKLQRTKTLNDAFAQRFVALGSQIEVQNPETLQQNLFRNAKGPNRAKSMKAFNKLQEHATDIFREEKMDFINRRLSSKKTKEQDDSTSLTPTEPSKGRIRFNSGEATIISGEFPRRRRSQSDLVTRRKSQDLGLSVAPPGEHRNVYIIEVKPADGNEDVPPPVGPRRQSSTSNGSVGTSRTQNRDRTESNISAIKTLLELTANPSDSSILDEDTKV